MRRPHATTRRTKYVGPRADGAHATGGARAPASDGASDGASNGVNGDGLDGDGGVFASKADMVATENPVIQQFLAGRPQGPIGMDEMADSDGRAFLEGANDPLSRGPIPRPGEVARAARAPSNQPVPPA
jgi:hypothetical protein